jgi:hypothetical protein
LDALFVALEALPPVAAIRFSRWGYAALNASHILAIALLVGGAIPLSLRFLGLWSSVPRAALVRVLSLSSGTGLCLALMSGALLFAIRATEYSANPAFQIKMLFILVGATSAGLAHRRYGWRLQTAPDRALYRTAIVSVVCWTGALFCGRLIAFVNARAQAPEASMLVG